MLMNRVVAGSDANTYGRSAHASSLERLARQYMPLVRKIAWHVHGRVSSAIEIEDLLQIGMVALVEAANGFEDRGMGLDRKSVGEGKSESVRVDLGGRRIRKKKQQYRTKHRARKGERTEKK